VTVELPVGFSLALSAGGSDREMRDHVEAKEGSSIIACVTWSDKLENQHATTLDTFVTSTIGTVVREPRQDDLDGEIKRYYHVDFRGAHGVAGLEAMLQGKPERGQEGTGAQITAGAEASVHPDSQSIVGDVNVAMRRTATEATEDLGLWVVIRK